MANKSIAFFVTATTDSVTSIDQATYNESITSLVSNSQGAFWIQNDDDSIPDLCTSIPDNITSISGTFIHSGTSYNLISHDFIGGRPVRRPK